MLRYLLAFFWGISAALAQQSPAELSKLLPKQLDSLSRSSIKENNHNEALRYTEAWLKSVQGIDTAIVQRSQAYTRIGNIHLKTNQLELAEKAYIAGIENLERHNLGAAHKELYHGLLTFLAKLYREMGRYENAEGIYFKTLASSQKISGKNSTEYATILNNLSNVYIATSRYAEAEKLMINALNILKINKKDKEADYAKMLNNLAALYRRAKQLDKAEDIYIQVIELYNKLKIKNQDYAISLNNLAKLYGETQRYDKAEKLYFEAIAIYQNNGKQGVSLSNVYTNLAGLYENKGEFQRAIAAVNQAFVTNTTSVLDTSSMEKMLQNLLVANHLLPVQSIKNLKRLSSVVGQLAAANDNKSLWINRQLQITQTGQQLLHQFFNGFYADADKLLLLEEGAPLLEVGLANIKRSEKEASANAELVLMLMEQNKSALLSQALKGERASSFGGIDSLSAAKEKKLTEQLAKLKKQEAEADSKEKAQALKAKINDLMLEIKAFEEELSTKYPRYYQLKYASNIPNLQKVQAMLGEDEVLLEYFWSKKAIYILRIEQKTSRFFEIKMNEDSSLMQIKNLRESLSSYQFIKNEPDKAYTHYTEIAHAFYLKFVAPALEGIAAGRSLIFISDGALWNLPFEALLDAPANGKPYSELPYLLKKYKISYNYSVALWQENLNKTKSAINGKVLAMATDYNQKIGLDKRSQKDQEVRSVLVPLPSTQKEINALAANLQGEFLLNATEANFKQKAAQFGIIHFAMHGLLDTKQPLLSALVFSEDGDAAQDNFLQAYEISQLDLQASLVVLSACETGYGKFTKGEGVMSLARSFMYAGAPALVVSLWQVNDASTAQLMQYFYKNLTEKKDKATALQDAKIQYLSDAKGTAAHPAFWSPFILLGDSQAIAIEQKSNMGIWWYALGGLVLLAVLFFGRRLIIAKAR